MSGYRYETHLHTSQASACGLSRGNAYVRPYLDAGYSGVIVTDHFFNGNTNVPHRLPWKERIRRLCTGYEEAKQYGDQTGLSVFFGFEFSYGQDEFLIYGLSPEYLADHPEIMGWDHRALYETVDREGGLVVQAHPFRERGYLSRISLHPHTVHAVETINGENEAEFDRKARRYAERHGLPMIAGADIHDVEKIGRITRATIFDRKLDSIDDFIREVKAGRYALERDPDREGEPSDHSNLPVYLHDAEGRAKNIQAFEAWM